MNETSNIVPLRQPDEIDDPLTNVLLPARRCAAASGTGSRGRDIFLPR